MGRRKKARVIGFDGHFRAIVAHLIKDPLLKLHGYIRILLESQIQVLDMVLRL